MNFWDSSALVALLVQQKKTDAAMKIYEKDSSVPITWWASSLECLSAIRRLEREKVLTAEEASAAASALKTFSASWHEVAPTNAVRERAKRLVNVHPLKTADSLQLAAALIYSESSNLPGHFVSFDLQLNAAARKEGLEVLED